MEILVDGKTAYEAPYLKTVVSQGMLFIYIGTKVSDIVKSINDIVYDYANPVSVIKEWKVFKIVN